MPVKADIFPMASRIGGVLIEVRADINVDVGKGTPLIRRIILGRTYIPVDFLTNA